MFESDQLGKERDRLVKLDSLTVLDYIRTSIEILMQLKNDDGKETPKEGGRSHRFARDGDLNGGAASEFNSTFQSLDFPPKEYETQLQVSEAEVRNHIKVEQQLKLHIEVLQEKIDDFEKKQKLRCSVGVQVSDGHTTQLELKQQEVDRLTKELKKHQDFVN